MSTVKEPLHPLRTARYLWLGILLCALVGGACFLGGRWSAGRSETAKIDTVVLQNQLSEIRELATVTYAYTNMAQFESSNDFYGVKIPFTTKSFILTYDGTVKAGVDLDGAEVSVSGTTVTITLPEAEIVVDAACCAGVTPESYRTALRAMKACQIAVEHEGETD